MILIRMYLISCNITFIVLTEIGQIHHKMPLIIFEKYVHSLCLIMVLAQALYVKLQSALIPSQPMMDDYADRRVLRITI